MPDLRPLLPVWHSYLCFKFRMLVTLLIPKGNSRACCSAAGVSKLDAFMRSTFPQFPYYLRVETKPKARKAMYVVTDSRVVWCARCWLDSSVAWDRSKLDFTISLADWHRYVYKQPILLVVIVYLGNHEIIITYNRIFWPIPPTAVRVFSSVTELMWLFPTD